MGLGSVESKKALNLFKNNSFPFAPTPMGIKTFFLYIQDSGLLYYLIREIKPWLNINHITAHSNIYCIFLELEEQLLKIPKYIQWLL